MTRTGTAVWSRRNLSARCSSSHAVGEPSVHRGCSSWDDTSLKPSRQRAWAVIRELRQVSSVCCNPVMCKSSPDPSEQDCRDEDGKSRGQHKKQDLPFHAKGARYTHKHIIPVTSKVHKTV